MFRDIMVHAAVELDRMAADGREKDEALTYLETASMWAHKALANGFHPNPYDRSIEAMKAYPGDPSSIGGSLHGVLREGTPRYEKIGPGETIRDNAGHVCSRECNHD